MRKSAILTIATGLTVGTFIAVAAPWIVSTILGRGFESAVPILRILSVTVPAIAASNVLGIQWMIPLRMEKPFTTVILAAAILNMFLVFLLARRYGAVGMAIGVDVAEVFVVIGALALLNTRKTEEDETAKTTSAERGETIEV